MILPHTIESKRAHQDLRDRARAREEKDVLYTREREYNRFACNPSAGEAEAGQLLEAEVHLDYISNLGLLGLPRVRPLAQNTTDNRGGRGTQC